MKMLHAAIVGAAVAGWAQVGQGQATDLQVDGPEGEATLPPALSPEEVIERERRRWLAGAERELRVLRATYFRGIRNVEMRQIGISKLREYNDPAVWPTMLDLFAEAEHDVRLAILDMFAGAHSDEGDATLAWVAVFDEDEAIREAAMQRLERRLAVAGDDSDRIRSVVAHALTSDEEDVLNAAAHLADRLSIVEAIPALISAQISGQSEGGANRGALAYILVGTQVAFVSDLTPIVADSAVAFDPTISVATDGAILRVVDAVVVTYYTEVHQSLVNLSSRAWGQSTADLGWDQYAWRDWYLGEFVPYMEAKRRAETRAADPDDK